MIDTDGWPSEITVEKLQKLRKRLTDVADRIVKGRQKAALANLREIEAIVIREQPVSPTAPAAQSHGA